MKAVLVKQAQAGKGALDQPKAKPATKEAPGKVQSAKNAPTPTKAAAAKVTAMRKRVVRVQNLEPLIQQFAQQGRPMLRGELLFVRGVCRLPTPLLRELGKEADATLKDVARKMAEAQQNGVMRRPGQRGNSSNPDPARMLQESLAAAFKKHLDPEQQARYQAELEKRTAHRKEAGLRFLVDALDRELLLSSQQRDRMSESLAANWDDSWCTYLDYLIYGNQFFPQEIDKFVTPVLNETQKKTWLGTQKVGGFWGFGGIFNVQNDGDPLSDILGEEKKEERLMGQVKAVRRVEVKKAP